MASPDVPAVSARRAVCVLCLAPFPALATWHKACRCLPAPSLSAPLLVAGPASRGLHSVESGGTSTKMSSGGALDRGPPRAPALSYLPFRDFSFAAIAQS